MKFTVSDMNTKGLPTIFPIGHCFFAEARPPGTRFDERHWSETWTALLDSGDAMLAALHNEQGDLVGAVGGIVHQDANTDARMATELFWYVFPAYRSTGAGLLLLSEFEVWARLRGAQYCCMVALSAVMPVEVGAIYQKAGYNPLETYYVKALA